MPNGISMRSLACVFPGHTFHNADAPYSHHDQLAERASLGSASIPVTLWNWSGTRVNVLPS
jgi:hypothetical protein